MIRALHCIRHDEKSYKKGSLIEGLTAAAMQRLVDIKAAEFVISPEEEFKKQQVETPLPAVTPDQFTEYAKDLDDLYNADELKREAKEFGVDLTGITKKEDVIAAIINQGKADELLEDDEIGTNE